MYVCMYREEICLSEDNIKEGNTLVYQICSITKYCMFYLIVLSVGLCLASEIRKACRHIMG
jgi:hypothetical protein